jgi:LmbE family N-acetylglucosaminyl deacetylase
MSPTIVAVHAHPDDEALFTGGRLALAAESGQRTVLVCVTDGSLGFDPAGRSPLDEGHDRTATAGQRSAELREAASLLGIDRLVELGYADSGMAGWPSTGSPAALCNQPVELVGHRIAEVLAEESPEVVLTYAADGFYGHPDHMATHEATVEALGRWGGTSALEAPVMTPASIDEAVAAAQATGGILPEWLGQRLVVPHEQAEVTLVVDATSAAARKQAAVAAHASQIDNRVLAEMAPELFAAIFGVERYVRLGG